MTYGTKIFKNGKRHGRLIFSTGKEIILNDEENNEFEEKVRYWQSTDREILNAEKAIRYNLG